MRTRVSARCGRLLVTGMFGVAVWAATAVAASAQTVVTLNQPAQVMASTLRGGSFANTNLSTLLATRAADDLDYNRRAVLKFDTQNTIPAGVAVTSAKLTITVKTGSADATRNIAAYQVTTSWDPTQVTWNRRYSGTAWTTSGGDFGTKLDQEVVSNVAGTKVTFDVTALVKQAVSGSLGSSRYTRVALVDADASSSDSYREYYLPSDSNTAVRPTLQVTYGSTTTTTTTTTSTSTSTATLKVLQWNTHHGGVGTDGVWDPYRLMQKAASFKPDVVSLNEVERYTSWGNCDEPALLASLMKQYTGQTWYYKFSTATGGSTGNGDLVLSRFPFVSTSVKLLVYARAAVDVTIDVNGRPVNFTSTHLDNDSTSQRLAQISELVSWEKTFAEQRIIAGDFNAWPGSTENATMKQNYYDSWAVAQSQGTAVAYAGNTAGNTRNSRIDYIYYSHGATDLVLKYSQVFDVRDANGVMPSDHRPVMSVFTVK